MGGSTIGMIGMIGMGGIGTSIGMIGTNTGTIGIGKIGITEIGIRSPPPPPPSVVVVVTYSVVDVITLSVVVGTYGTMIGTCIYLIV